MTLWQDQPPQTRREARERERARTEALEAAAQGTRRAATVEPTPAGEIPTVTTPFVQAPPSWSPESDTAIRAASANAAVTQSGAAGSEAEFVLPTRPRLPRYENSFDSLLAPQAEPSDLFRPGAPAEAAEPVTVPLAVVAERETWPPQSETIVPERTLTRRELRAMLQAQEANEHAHAPEAGPVAAVGVEPIEPQIAEADPEAEATPEAVVELEDEAGPDAAPFARPVGHWSTSVGTDGHDLPFDQVIGQHIDSAGSGSATSALILPVVPSAPDATGPLTSTGEILVTGTIDLPRSLGATGQHPDRFDSADMDRLFDSETDANTSSVAPIRASRAISTHTSTRGMITPPKKRGGRLPVILAVTAAVLAVGVIALVVAGFIFKVF